MAKLNSTKINGDLRVGDQIAESGQKIDNKYVSQASISNYTITFKTPDGKVIKTITLPQ